eukprot:4168616-Alexandrium_andersonii.AAC.1
MAPRKRATPEEPPVDGGEDEGGDDAGLKAAVVEQVRSRLAQSLDLQTLRPALAAAAAQRLLDDGLASKLSVESIAQGVAAALAKELARDDSGLRAMVADRLAAKLVG